MEFEMKLVGQERLRLKQLLEDHDGCVDCGLTIIQSNKNGIGVLTQVLCPCGGSENITDYSVW